MPINIDKKFFCHYNLTPFFVEYYFININLFNTCHIFGFKDKIKQTKFVPIVYNFSLENYFYLNCILLIYLNLLFIKHC